MRLYTEEKDILIRLSKCWKLSIYDIYQNSEYSPAQIIRVINKYQRKLFLIRIGLTIYKTPIGFWQINNNIQKILQANSNNKYWQTLPKGFMRSNNIEINKPYINIKKRSLISILGMQSSQ